MDNLNRVSILLVEDNPADARLIMDYFKLGETTIYHVNDGAEALDYIYQRGKYKNASLTNIVILDMNLPKVNGMKVLETIKEDDKLNKIVVVVFGTSGESEEVRRVYRARANCYVVKPIDYDHFDDVLSCIEKFWLKLVRLPNVND